MKIAEDAQAVIRERAYHIWEKAGRPDGRADEHWFQAMQEVFTAPSMVTPEETKVKIPAAKKAPAKKAAAKKPA